jgi:hypothetical protein
LSNRTCSNGAGAVIWAGAGRGANFELGFKSVFIIIKIKIRPLHIEYMDQFKPNSRPFAAQDVDELHVNCLSEVSIGAFDERGDQADPLEFLVDHEQFKKVGQYVGGRLHLGSNMMVNLGRQSLANLIGGRDFPSNNWIVNQFSIGSYDTAPQFTDVTLSPQPISSPPTAGGGNTIPINPSGYPTAYFKNIASVDWPAPYFVRFELIIAANEACGYVIREAGLWTANQTLFARKVFPGILKTSTRGYSYLWVLRL